MDDEIRRLDAQIDQTTDDTLDATRRILGTATDTHKIGVDTLVTLNEQGEFGAGIRGGGVRCRDCLCGSNVLMYVAHVV